MSPVAPFPLTVTRQLTELRDPFEVFVRLRNSFGSQGCFLLESLAGPIADRGRAVIGFGALASVTITGQIVQVTGKEPVTSALVDWLVASGAVTLTQGQLRLAQPDSFWQVQRVIRDAFVLADTRPDEYSFGSFAIYGYDAVQTIEDLPREIPATEEFPELTLLIPQASVSFDLHQKKAEIIIGHHELWPELSLAQIQAIVEAADSSSLSPDLSVPEPISIQDSTTFVEYEAAVERALAHIVDGDIYQVQLGHELTITSEVDQLTVYQRLRQRNPSPYMCFVELADKSLISASPELFLKISGADMIMRPIAGTAPRTGDKSIDQARVQKLIADEKECAEHLMLVDLCRNDLGRVAVVGSVEVDELMVVENFSHVYHLVSNVIATKAESFDAYDVIQATFPAGTMTGAPKIRAMQIIEHLETTRRAGYAGAFGLLDVGGFVNTGLTIRSIFSSGQQYHLRASGGVVADSTPAGEWQETLAKLSATYWAVTNRELLKDQGIQ